MVGSTSPTPISVVFQTNCLRVAVMFLLNGQKDRRRSTVVHQYRLWCFKAASRYSFPYILKGALALQKEKAFDFERRVSPIRLQQDVLAARPTVQLRALQCGRIMPKGSL